MRRGAIPWFVRGDLDGFFGLAVDNLIQFLLILDLCVGLCGFDGGFVVGRVLPGAAVSLVLGNLFYAWQARRLARTERREVGDSLLGREGGERSDRTSAVRGSIVWLAADAGSCASPPRDRSKYLDRRRDR